MNNMIDIINNNINMRNPLKRAEKSAHVARCIVVH